MKRSVLITDSVSLSVKYQQLVITDKDTEEILSFIPIEDLETIIVDNTRVSITVPLITNLSRNNVMVVVCDEKHLPVSYFYPVSTNEYLRPRQENQISLTKMRKDNIWKDIVVSKIQNQSSVLDFKNGDGNILKPYYSNVLSGDSSNKEAVAAKVYWKQLFGRDFIRDRETGINVLLNYGYSIIRSEFVKNICGRGLICSLGIHHFNRADSFSLADDLMESYRAFVDKKVYDLSIGCDDIVLNKETKSEIIKVLYETCVIDDDLYHIHVGIAKTVDSYVNYIMKKTTKLNLPKFVK